MPVCCVSACWAGACACASAASATTRKSLCSLHSSQILIRHLLPNLISRCIPPAPLPRCCTRSIACGEGQCASPPPQVPLACLSQKIQAPPAGCHPPQLLVQSADWLLLPLSTGHWPLHDDGGGLGCRPMAAPATPAAVQAWGSTVLGQHRCWGLILTGRNHQPANTVLPQHCTHITALHCTALLL